MKTKDVIEDGIKEFHDKFIAPMDTQMRAMDLNNEPYVMASEKEAVAFLYSFSKRIIESEKQNTKIDLMYLFHSTIAEVYGKELADTMMSLVNRKVEAFIQSKLLTMTKEGGK